MAVDPYRGSSHCAFEIHKHVLAFSFGWQFEVAPIRGNELIRRFVEAVPGKALVGMRNYDLLKTRIVERAGFKSLRELGTETPVTIEGHHDTIDRRSIVCSRSE